MTSDEIRKEAKLERITANATTDTMLGAALLASVGCEIAAQLAELNEHLRAVDEAVFGSGGGKKPSGSAKGD